MPAQVTARPPVDATEDRQVRKLAHSIHAPANWIIHAKLVARSWDGRRTRQIAEELDCHPQTVREHLQAFNERGVGGLGMQPGSGRKPRLREPERSAILALVQLPPPGKPTYEVTGELAAPDPDGESEWTLATLTAAAQARHSGGAQSGAAHLPTRRGSGGGARGCGREARIPIAPPESPQGPASSRSPLTHRWRQRSSVSTNAARYRPEPPRHFPPAPGWAPHQSAARLRARSRHGVGLWGPVRARRAGAEEKRRPHAPPLATSRCCRRLSRPLRTATSTSSPTTWRAI
jgi:transposase